jgi:hypothetical protein
MQGAQIRRNEAYLLVRRNDLNIKLRQPVGFLFFFFVFLRALRELRGCNEVQRSRWTFYEVVNL